MAIDITVGIVGSGGDGVILLGEMLARASARSGLHAILTKSFGPQIRGGESSCHLRVSDARLHWSGDSVDALFVLSLKDVARFKEELRVKDGTLLVADEADETPLGTVPLPAALKDRIVRLPLTKLALEHGRSKQARNMVLAGVIAELLGWPVAAMEDFLRARFSRHGESAIAQNLAAIVAGKSAAAAIAPGISAPRLSTLTDQRPLLLLSGDEAFCLGAVAAGCRFMAGYPISPASEILEWMGRELPRLGGTCVQAEDEMAALTMALGASYGGVRALTASSGPGFSLMLEALGLAAMAELPVVICDVQRVGPSTGIPTRTEQADLATALYGGHGDAQRAVLAATDIASCNALAISAFEIAERFQLPVIVLLDQQLGQSVQTVEQLDTNDYIATPWRKLAARELGEGYQRFAQTPDGVSPTALPGTAGGEHLLIGLSHDEHGDPASSHEVHQRLSEKRQRKLASVASEFRLLATAGAADPRVGILTWGSSFGVCAEAAELLSARGISAGVLAPQILMPLPVGEMQRWIEGLDELLIFELSIGGQFESYLRSNLNLPASTRVFKRAGGMPLLLEEVLGFVGMPAPKE